MEVTEATVRNILTRTTGYLKTVTSHSLQPYRGCSFGKSLCGVGCYVQHNRFVTKGRPWGGFLEIRENAAESYRANYDRERGWSRRRCGAFSIFLSSATEPFLPQESRYQVTTRVLRTMREYPPDLLVLQTHSHLVESVRDLLLELKKVCDLRVHISIETDRDRIEGLPSHASTVKARFQAATEIHALGIPTVITVSPLLPIADPDAFFDRISQSADAVVIDHFIEGDGTPDGRRTRSTPLPEAMGRLDPGSTDLDYRRRIIATALKYLPHTTGVSIDGFAGRYLR